MSRNRPEIRIFFICYVLSIMKYRFHLRERERERERERDSVTVLLFEHILRTIIVLLFSLIAFEL